MKLTLAILALSAFAQAAFAKEPDCRAIKDTNARLVCYDAAYPPKSEKPVNAQDNLTGEYRDPFKAEADHTAAKLKNICRGC
ncbi:MAG TPA: hypothetical protein VNZ53_29715 [Steroidobacteraceae bacterium]|jgi:hypothetical protein|nr:hypothetical protein [Steroidobacteraceae bacterium]